MKRLNHQTLAELAGRPVDVPAARLLTLPERVLQFGAGVLLRGLPDDLIDAANRAGIFNGRVVVVKSTAGGMDPASFEKQDMLYTHCRRGLTNGRVVDAASINASVSRVLAAGRQWPEVLACAENPEIRLVISNTTEAGLRLTEQNRLDDMPPASYPGKLLAVLHRRYLSRGGRAAEGLVILPTELVERPGRLLQELVTSQARRLNLAPDFIDWLGRANHFCDTLVDRIVPGTPPGDQRPAIEQRLGYRDPLLIMSEPYGLWAIEAEFPAARETLSFAAACPEVIVTGDISRYREMKLRLLNGTHTLACGLALLRGFSTVKEAMADRDFARFVKRLMEGEIVPCLPARLREDALAFAGTVIERFRNPFLDHSWQKIAVRSSEKMKARNLPLILRQRDLSFARPPEMMALGLAAFLVFAGGSDHGGGSAGPLQGRAWPVEDERADWFAGVWRRFGAPEAVDRLLAEEPLWGTDLAAWPDFADRVKHYVLQLLERGAARVLATVNAPIPPESKPA